MSREAPSRAGLADVEAAGAEAVRRQVEVLVATRTPWRPASSAAPGSAAVAAPRRPVVLDLWSEDLVARIAAGATLSEVDAALPRALRLSAAAPHPDRTTVGAVFARAERGLRSDLGGGLRDRVLGLRALDGAGRLHAAGARVVKNVAGYDLSRLHHGAAGAFGLVLDVVVRLDARPQTEEAVFVPLAEDADPWTVLAQLRRPQVQLDPCIQVWIGARAAHALAWGDTAGLLVAVEGWASAVTRWRDEVAVRTLREVNPAPLRDRVGATGATRLRWPGPVREVAAWRRLERKLDPAAVLVIDLAAHEAHLTLPEPDFRRLGPRLEAVAPQGWFVESSPVPAGAVPTESAAVRAIVGRLKRAFDPHLLLPPVPVPLRWNPR